MVAVPSPTLLPRAVCALARDASLRTLGRTPVPAVVRSLSTDGAARRPPPPPRSSSSSSSSRRVAAPRRRGGALDIGNLAEPYGNRDTVPLSPAPSPPGLDASSSTATATRATAAPAAPAPAPQSWEGTSSPAPISSPPLLHSDDVELSQETKYQERCVLVVNLPWCILPRDVELAAGPSIAESVRSVEMLYSAMGHFAGKALVTLTSPQAASAFVKQADKTLLSGRLLATQLMSLQQGQEIVLPSDPTAPDVRRHNSMATVSLFACFLVSRFGGRVVSLSNVPQDFTVRRLSNMLWHGGWMLEPSVSNAEWNVCLTRLFHRMRRTSSTTRMPLTDAMVKVSRDSGARSRGARLDPSLSEDGLIDAGQLDPIFSYMPPGPRLSSRMHLIVFATESEAHRFVRRWHMQPFNPQELGWRYILSARILH